MFRKVVKPPDYSEYVGAYVMASLKNNEGAIRGYLDRQNGAILVFLDAYFVPPTDKVSPQKLDGIETVVKHSDVLFTAILTPVTSIDEE